MSTWLIIGACVQVTWMVYQRIFIRISTFKDLFDYIFEYGLIGVLFVIGGILFNILLWPITLVTNVKDAANPERLLKRLVNEEEEP